MKHIYEEAQKRNITIYPYQKDRFDNTEKDHIIPANKLKKLTDKQFKDYLDALYNVKNDNAGGYNGWVGAHKIFEELGFKKIEQRSGHRVFESYIFELEEIPGFEGTLERLDKLTIIGNTDINK